MDLRLNVIDTQYKLVLIQFIVYLNTILCFEMYQ